MTIKDARVSTLTLISKYHIRKEINVLLQLVYENPTNRNALIIMSRVPNLGDMNFERAIFMFFSSLRTT